MQKAKKTQECVENVQTTLVLAQSFGVDVTEPALVTDHRQHNVSYDDPDYNCKSETDVGLCFENSVGQNPRKCCQNVGHIMEEADK